MVEVRTFDGDATAAAAFTQRVWSDRYRLKIPVIEWSAPYFEWQLLRDRPGARDFLVAAYDGSRLVGTLFAEAFPFQLRGTPIDATMGSWLSVDPEYRRHGIARKLADEQARRHRARGARFMLGYGVAGTDGPRFWLSRGDTQALQAVGFWIRLLDQRRVAEWAPSLRDRLAARVLGPFAGGIPAAERSAGIRRFAARDLDACLELVRTVEQSADLGCRWTRERLAHQLTPGPLVRTWVAEREGVVRGLVNYYVISMTGRTTMPVAVIDLVAFGALPRQARRDLLDVALAAMAAEGAGLAMVLRLACFSGSDLRRAGFVPTLRDSRVLLTVRDPDLPVDGVGGLHVLWR